MGLIELPPISGPGITRLSEMLASFPTPEAAVAAADARSFDRAAPPAAAAKQMALIWGSVSRALDLFPANLDSRREELMAIEAALAAATTELRRVSDGEGRQMTDHNEGPVALARWWKPVIFAVGLALISKIFEGDLTAGEAAVFKTASVLVLVGGVAGCLLINARRGYRADVAGIGQKSQEGP